jgi:hypothetical protein
MYKKNVKKIYFIEGNNRPFFELENGDILEPFSQKSGLHQDWFWMTEDSVKEFNQAIKQNKKYSMDYIRMLFSPFYKIIIGASIGVIIGNLIVYLIKMI